MRLLRPSHHSATASLVLTHLPGAHSIKQAIARHTHPHAVLDRFAPIYLSRTRYLAVWAIVFLTRALVAAYLIAMAGAYLLLASPIAVRTRSVYGLPAANQLYIISIVFAGCGSLYLWHAARMIFRSLQAHRLVFRIKKSRKIRRASSRHLLLFTRGREGFHTMYKALFSRRGLFGIEHRYFFELMMLREFGEVVAQTYQTYSMSWLLPDAVVRHSCVFLLVVNCWSTTIVHVLLRTEVRRQRLLCLIVDGLFDFIWTIVVPAWILIPHMLSYEPSQRQFQRRVLADDSWSLGWQMGLAQVCITSFLDLFFKLLPTMSMFTVLTTICRMICRQEEPCDSEDSARTDPGHALHVSSPSPPPASASQTSPSPPLPARNAPSLRRRVLSSLWVCSVHSKRRVADTHAATTIPTATTMPLSHPQPVAAAPVAPSGGNKVVPLACATDEQASEGGSLPSATSMPSTVVATKPLSRMVTLTHRQRRHHRWEVAMNTFFFVCGLAVLATHLVAVRSVSRADSYMHTDCRAKLQPWFVRDEVCAFAVIDCQSLRLASSSSASSSSTNSASDSELAAAHVSALVGWALHYLTIAHCLDLEMPSSLQNHVALFSLDLYNTSVASWNDSAAIHASFLPSLRRLSLVQVNLTAFPSGLLHRTGITDLRLIATDLVDLPMSLQWLWEEVRFVAMEHSALITVPSVLANWTQLERLGLSHNQIEVVPDELTGTYRWLALNANPLRALPSAVPNAAPSMWLDLDHTLVNRIPSWLSFLLHSSTKVKVFAHETLYCESQPKDEQTTTSVGIHCEGPSGHEGGMFPFDEYTQLMASST